MSIGFSSGAATPCSFKHDTRELYVSVYRGDFTITRLDEELEWMESVQVPIWSASGLFERFLVIL